MKTIYRSNRDKKVFGVCGGLAEGLGIDPTIVRLVTVVATIFSSGAVIPIYIVAGLVMPREPIFPPPFGQQNMQSNPWGQGGLNQQGPRGGFGQQSGFGQQGYQQPPFGQTTQGHYGPSAGSTTGADLDGMMNDLEKKAMQREIEQLKAKLASMENNNENKNKGDV
jgi:phage shock protein C